MKQAKKVVLYPRVSSQKQLSNDSLPTQRREMERFADEQEYEVVRTFEEAGRSAKNTNRPALQDMLRWISDHPGEIYAVLVLTYDRAARSVQDHLAIRAMLASQNVRLISTTEPVTDDPHGKFMEVIIAGMAELNNTVRGDRSKLGMVNATKRGRWVYQAPVGYLNRGKNASPSLGPDPATCELVREAFTRVATGESPVAVYADLVARGFRSRRGRPVGRQTFYLEWWPHSEAAGLDVDSQDAVLDWCETYVDDHDDHPKRSELRDQVRLHRREQVVESLAEMKGKYRVVYADPPWQYNDSGASAEGSFGKAEDHYPTMPTEDIANLPIEAHSRPNSVLFMWVTVPMLPEAWKVLEGWGFTYKTHIVWDKDAHVVGNYVSCQHELLLICTRGSCTPDELTPMIDSVQTVKLAKRKHSAKPEDFRTKIIQRLYTRGPYLEMFGRHQVDGWTVYGNQIGTPVRDLASSSNTSAVSR